MVGSNRPKAVILLAGRQYQETCRETGSAAWSRSRIASRCEPRDRQAGKVIGGLHGRSEFGLVYVAWFFLPEDWRRAGIGSRVLAMAEEEGRRRGCTRIALTTLSIEAPGFYQKQGYDVAATIDCEPPGLTRYYMMKRL